MNSLKLKFLLDNGGYSRAIVEVISRCKIAKMILDNK